MSGARHGPAGPVAPAPDLELAEQIAGAWSVLLPRVDEIADQISATILERDAAVYAEAGPEMPVEIRRSTREHIRRGVETMAEVAPPAHRAIDLWRETGRRRARQGVPMELVLNAYSLGTRVLWEALLALRDSDAVDVEDHVLILAGQRIWAALDVQNAVLVDSYRRESARMQRRDLQRIHTVLDRLTAGHGADAEFAAEARAVLGVGPEDPVACVVAPFDTSLEEPLRAPEDRLERAGVVSHWHVTGGVSFGLLCGQLPPVADLVGLLEPLAAGRVGVAVAADGVPGFASAYQLALRTAETLPRGRPGVAGVTQRLPEVILGGSPEVGQLLVQETVEPLLAQPEGQGEVLVETLTALLEQDGSPTRAADRLYCHRNTVIYRLKRIEQLTGRSLADPRDKLLLTLGLMASGHTG